MNTCYVIARAGVSGGTGTLSYRLLSYLHSHDYHCAYLCCENNSSQTFTMIEKVVDELCMANDLSYLSQFKQIHNKYDSFVFLTYSIDEYISIDKLRRQYANITRLILYVTHCYAFAIPPELKIAAIKRRLYQLFIRIKFRCLIKALLENNSILFMDELTAQETELSLHLRIDRTCVRLLPINIKTYSDAYWKSFSRHEPFSICTMTRMDFPFKGYVLGLIDQFQRLLKFYDLKLYIAGDGPSEDELKEKINTLPIAVRDKICYKGSVAYSELESFYSQCDFAVAMGTVLLDAANYNVLGLPVKPYTRELKVGSLFMDNIDWLDVKGDEQHFESLINNIISLPDDKYRELVHEQHRRLYNNYSSEKFVDLITESPELGKIRLKKKDRFVFDAIKCLR